MKQITRIEYIDNSETGAGKAQEIDVKKAEELTSKFELDWAAQNGKTVLLANDEISVIKITYQTEDISK